MVFGINETKLRLPKPRELRKELKYRIRYILSYFFIPFDIYYNRFKRNNVMMIHFGRSGSTVLGDLLNQHSQIKWAGEIYADQLDRESGNINLIKPKYEESFVYKYLKRSMRGSRKKYFGFEVKFYHLKFLGEDFYAYLSKVKEIGVTKFVLLHRKNYLRIMVSSLIATETKIWHTKSHKKLPATQISINVENIMVDGECKSLLEFLKEYTYQFETLVNFMQNEYDTIQLEYEMDISDNPIYAYRKVCDYLSVDFQKPVIQFRKTNDYKLDEVIINFSEIESYLKGTPYQWMLYS